MEATLMDENERLHGIAERAIPGAGLGSYALPEGVRVAFAGGRGARLTDANGMEHIDYVGGAGALILGHSHPAIVAAMREQAAVGAHMFGTLSVPAIRLAERLAREIPCAGKIAYATTGSEATAYAMRLARAFTGRDLVLKFEGAYHGNHDYALTSTFPGGGDPGPHGQDDTAGRPAGTRQTMCVAPYNDPGAVRRIVRERKGQIAAVIVEPVQRIIAARAEFLHDLRKTCDEDGILLIIDEVVTGFRLAPGGGQERLGVTADLATYGKVVGAGGPLSVVAGRADVLDLCDPNRKGSPDYVFLNGTLHGNPLSASATLAMLDEIAKPGLHDRLNRFSDEACAEFQKVLDRHGIPAIAANVGSLWQILFMARPPESHADMLAGDSAAMRRLDIECMRRGIFALPGVRRFFSTAHGDREVEETCQALDQACRAIS